MPRLIKITVMLLLAAAVLCFAFYELVMHAPVDAQVSTIKQSIEAGAPTQLTGMVALDSDFSVTTHPPVPWEARSMDEKAKLAETWSHALAVASAAQDIRDVPPLSTSIETSPRGFNLDAWGRPFCVATVEGRILIASAGLSKDSPPDCSAIRSAPARHISQLPSKKLFILPSGYTLLAMNRQ